MKKIILSCALALGGLYQAQTYCTPYVEEGCWDGDVIDSFEMPTANFSDLNSGCSSTGYSDFSSQIITLSAGVIYPFSITHDYGSQEVRIWIDFDNDGTFNPTSELVASATSNYVSGNPITNGDIVIPASVQLGNYRMRVSTRFNQAADPCNNSGYGEYHDYTVTIGLPPTCLAPSGLTSNSITSNSANVQWNSVTTGVGHEYYISTSSTAPSSTTVATGSVTSSTNTVNLTSLNPSTDYYFWVRSVCSATDKSNWSAPARFSTQCGPTIPAYVNDFSSFPGNCWSQYSGGDPSTGYTGTDDYWYDNGFLYSGYTGAATVNLYSYSTSGLFSGWLVSNTFDLSGGNYTVSFDYAAVDYYDTIMSGMGSDDEVKLLISNDGGTTWTTLQTWNNANLPATTSTTFSLDLTGYNSANTKFAFYATNGSVVDPEDIEFFVDNFSVQSSTLATVETTVKKNDIQIYPNPFIDTIHISNVADVKNVLILDRAGRVVKNISNPSEKISTTELNSGVYIISIMMKDGSKKTIKAIKK